MAIRTCGTKSKRSTFAKRPWVQNGDISARVQELFRVFCANAANAASKLIKVSSVYRKPSTRVIHFKKMKFNLSN